MLERSVLTAIIGFLCGCLFYYVTDASVLMVLVLGSVGYFLGLILDNVDIKHQLETFHFTNLPTTQDRFQLDDIPEAIILYSQKENLTTVLINFQVDRKPQDFRLSVLKNLQGHQFRIIEDSGNTILNLTLDYPECNYTQLLSSLNQLKDFHFNIRERSLDFQNAIEKIIPGLVFTPLLSSDLQREENGTHDYHGAFLDRSSQSPPPSPSNNTFPQPPTYTSKKVENRDVIPHLKINQNNNSQNTIPSSPRTETESKKRHNVMDESKIMEDLLPDSSYDPQIPDLSPEEIHQLRKYNERQLEVFLGENPLETSNLVTADRLASVDQERINEIKTAERGDSVKGDFSNLNHSTKEKTRLNQFDLNIIKRIDEKTKQMTNERNTNLEIQKEIAEAKDDIAEQLMK
ncbi:MAG: hypothetical protein ACFFB5_05610 [Promethearchaeota archaeon]